MATIFRAILFLTFALGYVLGLPPDFWVPPSHGSPLPNGPIMGQSGKQANGQIRHRSFLQEPFPQMEAPAHPRMDRHSQMRREPTSYEFSVIHQEILNNPTGQAYILHHDGTYSRMHKPPGTLKYWCGRVKVFDDEGYLLYESSYCNWQETNHHVCCNAAEDVLQPRAGNILIILKSI
ncbi:hypothetical protein VP01_1141g5 [Puccinia sorghi]|uniref:Uncharacterized protein n=1 Tax=Puccinia sorghi TaxID=27349 RepID=A0A0L6VS57_9BASI|nr:hypothetical protein VP01_1141g5 [Puccinia sorghi]